jgi:hypothetical protein
VLQAEGRLATPGLFTHSYTALTAQPPSCAQPRSRGDTHALLAATAGVRWALDTGGPFPPGTSPHAVVGGESAGSWGKGLFCATSLEAQSERRWQGRWFHS